MTVLPADRYAVTADIHVQFLKSAEKGCEIELAGRVVRAGKQVAFCEAIATVAGEICAQARVTKLIVPA